MDERLVLVTVFMRHMMQNITLNMSIKIYETAIPEE